MPEPKFYYVCPAPIGNWLLHAKGCGDMSATVGRIFIGTMYTSGQALSVARIHQPATSSCSRCSALPTSLPQPSVGTY